MIGTMLFDVFSGKVGMVIRKHNWNNSNDYEHDDWDIEWNTGRIVYMTQRSMQLYINDYQKLKKRIGPIV